MTHKKPYFDTQDADEKIILLLRRHPLIFLGPIFRLVFGFALLFTVRYIIRAFWPALAETSFYPPTALAGYFFSLLLILIFFIDWLDYYLDVWIVTDRRIVNIEQRRLFNRQVSEQRIFRVQDVTSESVGLIPTIFKFGNVYVQTAGARERFMFKQVPQPEKVKQIIIDIHDELYPQKRLRNKTYESNNG